MKQLDMRMLHQLFIGELARVVARYGRWGFSQDASSRQSKSRPPFMETGKKATYFTRIGWLAAADALLEQHFVGNRSQLAVIGQQQCLDRPDLLDLPFDVCQAHPLAHFVQLANIYTC